MFLQLKNCAFLVCFTIMNKISYFQIAFRKINNKYNITSMFTSLLPKKKKTSPEEYEDPDNASKFKVIQKTIDETIYYKISSKDCENNIFKPCDFCFTDINLIDTNNGHEQNYEINISDDNCNFFCIDNIINANVLSWYFMKNFKIL